MIGRLRGRLLKVLDGQVLLDVNGVGYEIEIPTGAVQAVVPIDGAAEHDFDGGATRDCTLHTHLVVREDAQQLFGFSQEAERDLFRNLIRINGVGPKMALALLSAYAGADLARIVADEDLGALTRVPGVGKKTAERLLMELRNRFELLPTATADIRQIAPRDSVAEVEQALVALGYKPQHASTVVAEAIADAGPGAASADTQTLLRAALKRLAQKSEIGQ
ncbi:MAG: Holliday junction branch migration protein RuvA [Pseudomonadota bacterium]